MLTRRGIVRIPMTKEEYFRRAEIREECLQDWEEGEAIRMTPAHSRHGYFVASLFSHLAPVVKGKVRVEVFVDFGTRTFGADLVVLFPEHADRHVAGRIQGAPDIVVEVLSDDSAARDRTARFEAYQQCGVPWYWIGDPVGGTLEEYRNTPEGYIRTTSGSTERPFEPRAVPGLSVPLTELLED